MAKVKVYITPKKGVLDPQGKAVEASLHSLGYKNVNDLQIGRYIELDLGGQDVKKAEKQVNEMCQKLLANPVIEDFRFEVIV
ncbi:MAG: phosphoribosylformylglycinamidine synthase subunit PurS [Candidatus Margulisiibacteriota bacterium]